MVIDDRVLHRTCVAATLGGQLLDLADHGAGVVPPTVHPAAQLAQSFEHLRAGADACGLGGCVGDDVGEPADLDQ